MTLKENKAIVRKVIEAFNKRNLTLLDKLLAPDFTDHDHQLKGPEDVKQFLTTFCQGFPDFRMTIEDIIAEGDKVWVCIKETMTHRGEYHGMAPTNKRIKVTAVHNYRIIHGKVVEDAWHVADELDFYKQLGIIEYKVSIRTDNHA